MNIKRDIYQAIRAQILANVPEIKHCLLFNNQYNKDNEEEAFSYPNAFFEYSQLIWQDVVNQQTKADANITIHLGFERYQTEDLTYFDTIKSVYLALQGFSIGSLFTGLKRIEEVQDTDHDNVIVWKIIFSTQITDCEATADASREQFTITSLEVQTDLDIDQPVIRTGDGNF